MRRKNFAGWLSFATSLTIFMRFGGRGTPVCPPRLSYEPFYAVRHAACTVLFRKGRRGFCLPGDGNG